MLIAESTKFAEIFRPSPFICGCYSATPRQGA